MYDRIYCVPTHREILDEFLINFFEEVEYANRELKTNCPLIIFEDTDKNINKEKIRTLKKKYPDCVVHYITRKDVVTVYDLIYSQLNKKYSKIFKKLYPNSNVNYGNVFNRIFLFSVLFGARNIHRRDSDILSDRERDGTVIHPIKLEIESLSKKCDGRRVYISGGGYKGKYNLDIDDLVRDGDYSLVKKLFSCMSIPEKHHEDIIQEEIIGNNLSHTSDVIEYNSGSYPECGNIGLYKIHEFFPSSTQDFVLGSDYFFIETAIHSGLNLAYHNRATIHKHTPDRIASPDKIYNYWRGLMMLIDSQIFYRNLYEKYLDGQTWDISLSPRTILPKIISGMKEFFPKFIKEYSNERKEKANSLINILSQSSNEVVRIVSNKLKQEINPIFEYTNQSINEHIMLLDAWRPIVKATKNIAVTPFIKKVLNSTLLER